MLEGVGGCEPQLLLNKSFLPQGMFLLLFLKILRHFMAGCSLATVGNILEDTIPNEFLSSQRAFYCKGETFVGFLVLRVLFLLV